MHVAPKLYTAIKRFVYKSRYHVGPTRNCGFRSIEKVRHGRIRCLEGWSKRLYDSNGQTAFKSENHKSNSGKCLNEHDWRWWILNSRVGNGIAYQKPLWQRYVGILLRIRRLAKSVDGDEGSGYAWILGRAESWFKKVQQVRSRSRHQDIKSYFIPQLF